MGSFLIVFNVGSSTLKVAAYDPAESGTPSFSLDIELQTGACTVIGSAPKSLHTFTPNQFPEDMAEAVLTAIQNMGGQIQACVHRVMHGGPLRRQPQLIDDSLLDDLERYEVLCPLHQPAALEVIRHLRSLWPDLTQVAVYDTAFHLGQSPLATEYALPLVLRHDGIRAYGFHGISCQHILRQLRADHGPIANTRLVFAHIGHGVSMTAVNNGRSIANTMGFSTLEGLPMSTRCGHIDPGILLYLLEKGWAKSRLTDLLYHQSGLLGLSGISADMRVLLQSNEESAKFAVSYFCYRAAREAASLACAMEGLDAMVFTGGIGEHQAMIRTKIVSQLGWLGAQIDEDANARGHGRIDSADSRIKLLVLPADEELEMSLQARALLHAPGLQKRSLDRA